MLACLRESLISFPREGQPSVACRSDGSECLLLAQALGLYGLIVGLVVASTAEGTRDSSSSWIHAGPEAVRLVLHHDLEVQGLFKVQPQFSHIDFERHDAPTKEGERPLHTLCLSMRTALV